MVAKIHTLNSRTNLDAKIYIRVFKISEQLRLKFGKQRQTASLNLVFIGSYKEKYTICRNNKTTASFFDVIQFSLFLPFLAWKQQKVTYVLDSSKFNATVTTTQNETSKLTLTYLK